MPGDGRRPRRRARRAARPRAPSGAPSHPRRDPAPSSRGPPGDRPRASRGRADPARLDSSSQPPQRTGPSRATGVRSSQTWSYSRTATTPSPRSTRFEPARAATSSASARSTGRGSAAGSSSAREDVPLGGRVQLPQERDDLPPDQAARRCRRSRSRARKSSPSARQYASVSSRQTVSSGRTTPSSRRTRIPVVVPLDDEPEEDRLDLVGGGVPRRAQPVGGDRVAQVAQLGLGPARRGRVHDLRAEGLAAEARVLVGLGAAQAVVHVQRGDPVAERARARARGRSSRRRRRRGRATSPPRGTRSCRRTCSSIRARRAAVSTRPL